MSNERLVAFAKEHSMLTILERELVARMDAINKQQARKDKVQSLFNWAKERSHV
jgi:hypothetical protein